MRLHHFTILLVTVLIAACVSDNTGKSMDAGTDSNQPNEDSVVDLTQPDATAPMADLIVNEIMYAPKAVYDDKGEWIELLNRGSEAVNLNGWILRDNGFDKHVIQQSITVGPGQYVVLGNNADQQTNGGYSANYEYDDFQLKDLTGDSVQLVDSLGRLVDSVSFKVNEPWPTKNTGTSIERIGPDRSGSAPSSWTHAVATYGDGDKGTPGMPNGVPVQTFEIDKTVEDWQIPDPNASLHFAPDGFLEDWVIKHLLQAEISVQMVFFNVRLPEVLDTLILLDEAGVDVDVLLDKKQQDLEYNTMGEEMLSAGINVTLIDNQSAEKATMHHKYTVIDGEYVLMGSANYSWTAFNKSDEDLLILKDSTIADRLEKQVDDLLNGNWDKKSPSYENDDPIQIWMGPADDPYKIVMNALDEAQSTVLVALFQVNYEPLVQALISAKQRGCTVAVILDKKQAEQEENLANSKLTQAGVDVFLLEKTNSEYAEMHSKYVVIDNERVLMGSYNWTAMASFFNNETLVDIRNDALAQRTAGKFSSVLATVPNVNIANLGGLTTPQEVTFSVGNISLDPDSTLRIMSVGGGPFSTPVPMNGTSLSTSVDRGTTLTYRYQVISSTGTINETGINHVLYIPYWSESMIIEDIFRL